MKAKHRADPGLVAAIKAAKSITALAEGIGTTPQAVSLWERVPEKRVFAVERFTGVSRKILRPDIHDVPLPKRQRSAHAHV